MSRNVLVMLQEPRNELQIQLDQLEKGIGESTNEYMRAAGMRDRDRTREELRVLDLAIEHIQDIQNGRPVPSIRLTGNGVPVLREGQLETMKRVGSAMEFYLSFLPPGEFMKIADLVDALQKAGMTVHTKRGKAKGTRRLVDTQVVTSTLSNYRSAFQGNEKKGMKKKDTVSPFIRDERNYAVRLRQPDEYPPGEKETESRKMEVTRHRSAIAP